VGRIALGWVALAACYAPHAPAGSPCDSDQQCPDGLVCSPSTNTCETSTGDAPSGPWLAGYAHRKKLVVTAASDLVEFPVSVAEPADPDLAAGAMADGSDIVFTAGDATTIVASELVE